MKKLFTSVLAAGLVFSSIASTSFAESNSFTDIEGSYAKDAILELQSKGIISGSDATHFAPRSALSRAEFVTMMVMSLGLDTSATKSSFSDVSGWAVPYVQAAYDAGIVSGVSNRKFAPNATVTREMAASILVRALQTQGPLDDTDAILTFTDSGKISDWAKPYIALAQKYGLIKGNPDGTFNPRGKANREMAAVMAANLLISIDAVLETQKPSPEPTVPPVTPPVITPVTPPVTPPVAPVVKFIATPSFTGSVTSDFRVTIDGVALMDYSLYYDEKLVGSTTNGTLTSVSNIFVDIEKLKIHHGSVDSVDSDKNW